jgi:hypothetical protein
MYLVDLTNLSSHILVDVVGEFEEGILYVASIQG